MSAIPSPPTLPFPYQDYVIIGGDQSPGQATIIHGKRPSGWDERKGYQFSGAYLWPIGDPLGTFSIRFDLWDEGDMPAWQAFYDKYFSPTAKLIVPGELTPNALTILHPVLLFSGLQECVVLDRGVLTKDELGLWSQTIDFKQFRPPKAGYSPPIAAIPGHATPKPTAQSQAEKDLQAAQADLNAIAGPPK